MQSLKKEHEMKNFYILSCAINYIEVHLTCEFTLDDVARACYSSLSGLKKLFQYAFHHGLKEYISKRRLTSAAHDLLSLEMTVTQIAMKYQYNSPEVFTRAFIRLWGTSPSSFKRQWKFTGIFPKILFEYNGDKMMSQKNVDISELYDLLASRINSYVICFDMVGLLAINETYGREAGDKAILECLKRIDNNTSDNCLLFRIGGDEFALVADSEDIDEVDRIARRIIALNDQPIVHNGVLIPISLRAACAKIAGKNVRYSELYGNLNQAIMNARAHQSSCYILPTLQDE